MLNAFRHQLIALSKNPKDPFTQHIRSLIGPREAPVVEAQLRQLILSMPTVIRQTRQWLNESQHPWEVNRLHNFVLAYLYNPEDFLPERTEGFFGYLDDAYLVASAFERTTEMLDLNPMSLEGETSRLIATVPDWLRACRRLLPDVTARIDRMLDQLNEESPSSRADLGFQDRSPSQTTILKRRATR